MGALGALGMFAPIGETLAGITNPLRAQQQQQDAQTKLLEDLVGSNPEYQPILDYAKAGGKDVIPMLGGNVGKEIQSAFRQQKFQQLMQESQSKGWSPTDFLNQAAAQGVITDPDEYMRALTDLQTPKVTSASLQSEVQDFLRHPPARMPADQLARLQAMDLNNPSELLDAHKLIASYGAATPEKALHYFETDSPDINTGWPITWEHGQEPLTGQEAPGFPRAVGLKLPAPEQQSLTQAYDLLETIPEANQTANNLIDRMNDLKKAGVIAPGGERAWLVNQFRRYTADRKAAGENPLDPLTWGYYTKLPTTDPVYSKYATMMGQTQSMIAGPMKIFRSMGLFQTIAPHIDAPENTPEQNLEALRAARTRFSRDTDYLRNLSKGLGLPQWGGALSFAPPTVGMERAAAPPAPPAGGGRGGRGGGGADPVGSAIDAKMRERYGSPVAGRDYTPAGG